jgi:hypothetical protein
VPEVGDADDLYRLPPEEFTAARDALVRKLRAGKERERAEEIKKLRRPSVIAWALNQVARAEPESIDAVLDAGVHVKDALERGDGAAMREAERKMRGASDVVVEKAGDVLAGAVHGATDESRSRVAATLRAALVDTDVAERVRSGTLDREVELAGLGLDGMALAAPRQNAAGPSAAAQKKVAELEAKAERLATQATRLAGSADRAEAAARRARADADTAADQAAAAAEEASAARSEQQ